VRNLNGGGLPLEYPGSALVKSIGNSTYNGLQVNLQKRPSNGFQIQGAYTFSHAISDVNDPLNPVAGNNDFPHNSFDLKAERGNSDFDIRHRGVVNFIYEPNIGRGRGHFTQGIVGRLLEGWSLTGVIQAQTGHPYNVIGNPHRPGRPRLHHHQLSESTCGNRQDVYRSGGFGNGRTPRLMCSRTQARICSMDRT
jgi:hypothetical protein